MEKHLIVTCDPEEEPIHTPRMCGCGIQNDSLQNMLNHACSLNGWMKALKWDNKTGCIEKRRGVCLSPAGAAGATSPSSRIFRAA